MKSVKLELYFEGFLTKEEEELIETLNAACCSGEILELPQGYFLVLEASMSMNPP